MEGLQRINTGESNLSPRRTKSDGDARLLVAGVATGASKLPRREDQFASAKDDNTSRLARVARVGQRDLRASRD